MNIFNALDNMSVIENRKIIDLEDVKILLDWTPEGYISKICDENGNAVSPIIRGFENKEDLNKFIKNRFGLMLNENFEPTIIGNPIPRFKSFYVRQWERVN